MTIGFIGLGNMGAAMARNLIRAGHPPLVFDKDPARVETLAAQGATGVGAIAGLRDAEVVISMVPDDAALAEVARGEGGLLGTLQPDAVHVSMSTVSPAISRQLAADHRAVGQHFLAAPVFGRPDVAADAKLGIVVAGETAIVERCRPLFEAMGRVTFQAGEDPGAANVVKLGANFMVGAAIETLAEVFALIRKQNVDPQLFLEIITSTFFPSPVYRTYGAMIASGTYEPPGFNLLLALKDLTLIAQAADEVRVPMPINNLVRNNVMVGIGRGLTEYDYAVLGRLAAEDVGLPG